MGAFQNGEEQQQQLRFPIRYASRLKKVILFERMAAERLINYNKRLYGPGPVARLPASGIRGYYARMSPIRGFSMAASHGLILGFAAAFYYKFFMGDVDTKRIEDYYRENPPR